MGDFFALIEEIKSTTSDMDYCRDFHEVQLTLNNVNKYIHPLNKIFFDGGNEPYIIEVVARLLKYFRTQRYLNAHNKVDKQFEPELRRITMYLLVNTDVSFRYDLKLDKRVGQLLNTSPQITKCLLMNCIWGLDLDRFFYEMLRYAPLWFSMQFLDEAIVSLKNGKPHDVLTRIESIVCAIYFAIYRTDVDWGQNTRSEYVNRQRTIERLCGYVAEILQFVNTPNASKFHGWAKVRKHRYFGYLLKHMFSMTMTCLDIYFCKPPIPVDPAMAVYQLMSETHIDKSTPVAHSKTTESWLLKLNHCMLNTLEVCIMHVSLECYVYWAEIDLYMDGLEVVSLQRVIGNFAYRLCEVLNSHKNFRHGIVRHLTQFALRPKTLAERAAMLGLGTLMRRLESVNSPDERLVYLTEFINRGDQILDNDECVNTIEAYWELLTVEHLRSIIEFDGKASAVRELTEVSEARMHLREIVLRAVGVLPPVQFYQLLKHVIAAHGKDFIWNSKSELNVEVFVNQIMTRNAAARANNTLSNEQLRTVQQLIFRSPQKFFESIFDILQCKAVADIEEYRVKAVAYVFVRYMGISKLYIDNLLHQIFVGFTIMASRTLGMLLNSFCDLNLVPLEKMVENYLLQGLKAAYDRMKVIRLDELLTLMTYIWPKYRMQAPNDPAQHARVLRDMVKILSCISNRFRYKYPEDELTLDEFENRFRLKIVWKTITLLVPTVDQLMKSPLTTDSQILPFNLETVADTYTAHYFLNRMEEDHPLRDAPYLTQTYLAKIFTPPDDEISAEVNSFHLLKILVGCTREEITPLASVPWFTWRLMSVPPSSLVRRLKPYNTTAWAKHAMVNYVECMTGAVLPFVDVKRHDCIMSKKVVDMVIELLQGVGKNFSAIEIATANLIRCVRRVAPAMNLDVLTRFSEGKPIQQALPAPKKVVDVIVIDSTDESS
ncbi:uncharacterized protein LOC126558557 [Anopheles maculipalpis]|uniref:uncharacterized protein LOC126558557 n=1 Tax=Anopheles maculipalpis TaxID=1496333 RepID=UPI002158CD30|nr:uncharacterized protein LOC126558557 [Anopheles maculipalpis]